MDALYQLSYGSKGNGGENGRGGRIRTHDMRFWRPPFYQLNYAPAWNLWRMNSFATLHRLEPATGIEPATH